MIRNAVKQGEDVCKDREERLRARDAVCMCRFPTFTPSPAAGVFLQRAYVSYAGLSFRLLRTDKTLTGIGTDSFCQVEKKTSCARDPFLCYSASPAAHAADCLTTTSKYSNNFSSRRRPSLRPIFLASCLNNFNSNLIFVSCLSTFQFLLTYASSFS